VIATPITAAGVVAALLMISDVASAALPSSVEGAPVPTLAPMVKRVSPAIVNISASGTVDIRKQNPGETTTQDLAKAKDKKETVDER